MNAMLGQCLMFVIILTLTNFYATFCHPFDNETEDTLPLVLAKDESGELMVKEKGDNSSSSSSSHNGADKVTQNYVEALVRDEKHLKAMRMFAVEWAHNNALIFKTKQYPQSSDVAVVAPCSIFPSPFPRHGFNYARSIQKALNELYFRVGTDFAFLEKAYSDLIKTDAHFRNVMNMLRMVHEEGIKQPITVVYQRADYMLNVIDGQKGDEPTYEIKQLEVNCGSITGTNVDRHVAELNHVMLKRAGFHAAPEDLPENLADSAQIESIKMAWEAYDNSETIVLIIQSPFTETFEARFFETELDRISDGKIKVGHVDMLGCAERCSLDDNFNLRFDGREVAVVQSRYSVLGFKSSEEIMTKVMNVRRMLERSRAIKIPSAFIGFSCSKKVQQLLAEPGQLEYFLPKESEEMIKAIRKTFAGMWSLENKDEETEAKIKDAIEHPENYVLKSNMECGGNNFFDEEIPEKLSKITLTERPFYILMQKLRPMPIKNIMIRPNIAPKIDTMVSELGVYGVLIGDMITKEVKHNVQQGHLLKTKLATANEGGISTGSAVQDSPILF